MSRLEHAFSTILDTILTKNEERDREGIKETPFRAAQAWRHHTAGYHINPESVLKTFKDGAENYDEMIVVAGIPFYSHCEHHLAPFFGTVTVGYVPNGTIVGLSKFSRLVDVFAQRLQVQERMTAQIADTLFKALKPMGVGVSCTARHLCMESRGIKKQGSETTTNIMRGVFRTDPSARAEFMAHVR